jgi:predicted nucleic acid-binding protein
VELVFVDTGAFYALVDRSDPAHERARRFYAETRMGLLTSEFVFAETMSLVTKRVGKRHAVRLGEALRTTRRLRIDEVGPEMREAAWKLFSTRLDKDHDLVDCLSFAVMDANGVRTAFGFDRHFLHQGYELVPD